MDNSSVQVSSTHTAVEPKTTIRRWDRKQRKYVDVPCPAIIKEYHEHMGGVDLFDMLVALYCTKLTTKIQNGTGEYSYGE